MIALIGFHEMIQAVIGPLIDIPRIPMEPGTLLADLRLDALDRATIAVELDEVYGIEIPDADVEIWLTLADIAATLGRLAPQADYQREGGGRVTSMSVRDVHAEAVEMTLQSLQAYWSQHQHHAIAWSGGKDSTALLTLLIHLIDAGELPQPDRLHVFYADTRQELPPIQMAAEQIMARLRLRNWITVHVVRASLDKRFMVYILGRGVPPPNNNTLRWCTRQIKVEPMAHALQAVIESVAGTALMLTGVRQGESAIRDGRIAMSCSKDGAECGQGWYQQVLPETKGVRGKIATLAPLLHWRVCTIWDWLKVWAPMPEFGGWPTQILADAYGGDDATEINARTGCIGCPLASRDTALETIVEMPAWSHLRPLLELKPLYRWMREPAQRLRKAGLERLKSGAIGKNPQRMGPLTLEARETALARIVDIQSRAQVDLINAEELARIRELIAAKTFPNKWAGDEPRADTWMDSIYSDGSVQPLLFRDLITQ